MNYYSTYVRNFYTLLNWYTKNDKGDFVSHKPHQWYMMYRKKHNYGRACKDDTMTNTYTIFN